MKNKLLFLTILTLGIALFLNSCTTTNSSSVSIGVDTAESGLSLENLYNRNTESLSSVDTPVNNPIDYDSTPTIFEGTWIWYNGIWAYTFTGSSWTRRDIRPDGVFRTYNWYGTFTFDERTITFTYGSGSSHTDNGDKPGSSWTQNYVFFDDNGLTLMGGGDAIKGRFYKE